MGLAVHQMAGIEVEKIRAEFQLPEGVEPAAAIAVGYPGDPESLPERMREREKLPRERKGFAEMVYSVEVAQDGRVRDRSLTRSRSYFLPRASVPPADVGREARVDLVVVEVHPGADQGVNLVNEENRVGVVEQLLHGRFL